MTFKDYYHILGIAVNATPEEIKQAYRRLAQKYHPDVSQEADAEEQFKEVCAAYEILKDPEKRSLYNMKREILLPKKQNSWQVCLAWLRTKENHINQKINLFYAKKQADANAFRTKNYKSNESQFHAGYQFDTSVGEKITTFYSNYSIFLNIAIIAAMGVGIVMFFLSLIENFQLYTRQQQLTESILNNDAAVVAELEQTEAVIQRALLENQELKTALLQFYLHQVGDKTIEKLLILDKNTQTQLFNDDESKNLLINYYVNQIKTATDRHDFTHATQLLRVASNYYPNIKQFIEKQEQIEHQREKQLVLLTKRYVRCLQPNIAPSNCHIEQGQIYFDLQLISQYDTDLVNKVYEKYVLEALTQQQYSVVEQLVGDWERILPSTVAQRTELKTFISDEPQNFALWLKYPYLIPKKSRISKINQSIANWLLPLEYWKQTLIKQINTQQITQILSAFMHAMPAPVIEETIVADIPETLIITDIDNQEIVMEEAVTIEQPDEITQLLSTCQAHLDANRLATGKEGTALKCYQTVLAKEAGNATAQVGLQKIEQTYRLWLETALYRRNIEDAKTYLDRLQIVNAYAVDLEKFQQQVAQLVKENIAIEKKPLVESTTVKTPLATPPPTTLVQKEPSAGTCENCNCADLYRQLSINITPLTIEQRAFLDDCRLF